jgi:hypothetical protein
LEIKMAEKPAFYNNWKGGSVPTGSTMSGSTPNPYGGFQNQQIGGVQGTVDPAVEIYNMPEAERRELARLLKNAGFKVPTTGKYSDSLVNAYAEALQSAALQSTRLNKDFSLREYLTQEALPSEVGPQQPSIREDITIWDPTKIAGVVQDLSVKLLEREANPEEVTYIADKLTKAQKKAATRTQYVTKNGKVTATVSGGLDEEQFLVDLIQNDKKFAPEIKALQARKATAEASEAEGTRQELMKTALANGVNLDPDSITSFEQRLKAGEDITAIKNSIREIASLGMPDNVKKLIATGVDLSTIYSPYKRAMAASLDLDPNTISLDDPTLRMAIGPDKEMSLYDYRKAIRQDNRWKYSQEANDEVDAMINQVKRDFGFMG